MVSIIIPSRQLRRKKNPRYFYRSISSLPDLLDTIDHRSEREIIVVCNGEEDKELVSFVKSDPRISKSALLSSNAGVARAWNIGRNMAEGDFLLFVNDDALFGQNVLPSFRDCYSSKTNLGVVGPRGSMWKNCKHEEFAKATGPVDVVSGYAFMVPTRLFDEVGGIDCYYTPAGCEEVDFCFKVAAAGYVNYVDTRIEITTEPAHGISARNEEIKYFKNTINTRDLHLRNTSYLRTKWPDR